ncbi:MAG: hypothetical protein DRQ55_02920 [Planctomycetota bacterium]|nr:MAG: hypothetical protein DRQ55_02920 [Planctomycetota bacterium]
MSPNRRFTLAISVILVLIVVGGLRSAKKRDVVPPPGFLAQLELGPMENTAVHAEGRIKSFASFANSIMDMVTGPKSFRGQSPAMTYLDLMFRPGAYLDADLLYVKNKPLRAEIIAALREDGAGRANPGAFQTRMDLFLEKGLISDGLLNNRRVNARMQNLGSDLIRWGKFVQMLQNAQAWKQPRVLGGSLMLVPPVPATGERWSSILDLERSSALNSALPGLDGAPGPAGLPDELDRRLTESWKQLKQAWGAEDAEGVNAAVVTLAAGLREVNPDAYPAERRLALESFYFRQYNLTWIWMVYLLACIPLLLAVVYRWKGARRLALLMFLVAFGLHTWALGLRWYVSGRWPNTNMFEAVTTAAWFGGVAALAVLPWAKGVLGNVFLLSSAVASMVAMLCAYKLPVQLNPNIGNMMPVLHDVWLYIHTNIIIWSYVLIFMAAVSASLYLIWRACGGGKAYVKLGGAGMLAMGGVDEGATEAEASHATGAVLDGVTMVLMELSFIMLWAGLVMGAIWADHSWGRPWGWDPKEVFALNTFLVFTVLVHGRFKSRDKGLWTAWLALIGACVMLFNWVIINFVITGLHSYA